MASKTIPLKLVVDTEKKRVVFAESEKEFVDILISFLTIPIGTIVHATAKESNLGCMDNLYKSVENLETRYLETEACKTMLLHPHNAWSSNCKKLVLGIKDIMNYSTYRCPNWVCCTETHCLFSTVPNSKCRCGEVMNKTSVASFSDDGKEDGAFVKGKVRFMITDDLHITSLSTKTNCELFKNKFGFGNINVFEDRSVEVSKEEILQLLKCSLNSKTPLTNVFLSKINGDDMGDQLEIKDFHTLQSETQEMQESIDKKMELCILISKSSNRILYAEASEGFVDFLFSFLTFPLGSIVHLLGGHSSMGCVDNLYKSVQDLSTEDLIRSEEHKNILLRPNLAPHHSCKNQLLPIEEAASQKASIHKCSVCFGKSLKYDSKCLHGLETASLQAINPKYAEVVTDSGGGFVKASEMFMISDELDVKLASPTEHLSLLNKSGVPISDFEEKTINVGQEEAIKLLKASLISKTPLMDVFTETKQGQIRIGRYSFRGLN